MSVDDRLREAFRADDASWRSGSIPAYQAVVAGARRKQATRRLALGLAAAAVALVVGVMSLKAGDEDRTLPAPPAPDRSVAFPAKTSPLDGTWTTEPIRIARMSRVLRQAGLTQWTDDYAKVLPQEPMILTLKIYDGTWTLAIRHGSRIDTEDEEYFSVTGDRVEIHPVEPTRESTIHHWALNGQVLRLTFVSTTESPVNGIPGEVYQRALYTSGTFHRTS